MEQLYRYKVISVNKILDGDTVDLSIDLGFNLIKTDRYRLAKYDAPETFRPKTEAERQAGLKVKEYLTSLIEQYKNNLIVQTYKDTDIYGRYSGVLTTSLGGALIDLNEEVIKYMVENKFTKKDLLV